LNTFENAVQVFGNFTQMTMESTGSCSGLCAAGSNASGVISMSNVGSMQNGSFTYDVFNFTISGQYGSYNQTSYEGIYLNESNPALSSYATNGGRLSSINASIPASDE